MREITESEEFEGLVSSGYQRQKGIFNEKADEATKTRFRGHGSNVTKEEQGDCLKVGALLDYFLDDKDYRWTSWETR